MGPGCGFSQVRAGTGWAAHCLVLSVGLPQSTGLQHDCGSRCELSTTEWALKPMSTNVMLRKGLWCFLAFLQIFAKPSRAIANKVVACRGGGSVTAVRVTFMLIVLFLLLLFSIICPQAQIKRIQGYEIMGTQIRFLFSCS